MLFFAFRQQWRWWWCGVVVVVAAVVVVWLECEVGCVERATGGESERASERGTLCVLPQLFASAPPQGAEAGCHAETHTWRAGGGRRGGCRNETGLRGQRGREIVRLALADLRPASAVFCARIVTLRASRIWCPAVPRAACACVGEGGRRTG